MSSEITIAAPTGADLLPALGRLFGDLASDIENLRDLLDESPEPERLVCVIPDLLAVLAWRAELGRTLAGDDGVPRSTANEKFLKATTAKRLGL